MNRATLNLGLNSVKTAREESRMAFPPLSPFPSFSVIKRKVSVIFPSIVLVGPPFVCRYNVEIHFFPGRDALTVRFVI